MRRLIYLGLPHTAIITVSLPGCGAGVRLCNHGRYGQVYQNAANVKPLLDVTLVLAIHEEI